METPTNIEDYSELFWGWECEVLGFAEQKVRA